LERIIKENGSDLLYRQKVREIIIREGRAVGVRTEAGLEATADVIVSNASALTTLLELVGPGHLPSYVLDELRQLQPSLSNLVVYLGLKKDLRQLGWNAHHELFMTESYDPEEDYQAFISGDWERMPLVLTNYSILDDPAPEGGTVLTLFALASPTYKECWGTQGITAGYRQNPLYKRIKEDAADRLVARTEKLFPGLTESIVHREVATPLTNQRYSLNPGGAIYGFAQTVNQAFSGRPTQQSPIENLLLAGAWTIFGGGMSAAMGSGAYAARIAMAHLENEPVAEPWGRWPRRRRARRESHQLPGASQ
jgi:prolycopene isomerase